MTTEQQQRKAGGEDPTYMMGTSEAETRRLIAQSGFHGPFTRRLLEEAGISEGMKVLDVGAGAGDVALLAVQLVGPRGSVVGIDRNPTILETARARAAGLDNVAFVEGDLRSVETQPNHFDAVVGRLVFTHLPDPAGALRALARRVRSGGSLAFQEYNLTPGSIVACPPTPLWEQAWGWVRAAARQAGETEMGYKLYRSYLDAGLPEPKMELNSVVGGGPGWGGYDVMAETLRSMLPLILKLGIATEEEVGIDTLSERLRAETVRGGGVVKAPDLVSAWARKP